MTIRSSWQQAWDGAQPRLTGLRHSLKSQRDPIPRLIRVGQLDSELLDQELVHLLQEPLNNALGLINSSLKTRFDPELRLLIQLILYKLSIWNIGASYGAKLQDLKYTVPPSLKGGTYTPSGLPRRVLVIHGTLTVVLPYLHTRLRAHALSHAWPDAPSSDRRRKAWDILTSLESSYTLLGLLSFVSFLWDGRYRTLADRLLSMSLVPSRRLVRRDVSYEFMNRQMVWHAFTEFLLFLLPLFSARSIRRRLGRLTSRLTSALPSFTVPISAKSIPGASRKRTKYFALPQDQCAICAENTSFNLNLTDSANAFTSLAFPIQSSSSGNDEPPANPVNTPYVTSCGHVYCYHCISERMMRNADDGEGWWECLRCGGRVQSSERWKPGSELTGNDEYNDEYEFSDLDVSEISTGTGDSLGSYSYSDGDLSD